MHRASESSAQPSRRTSYLVFHSGLDQSQRQRVEEEEEEEEEGYLLCNTGEQSMITIKVVGAKNILDEQSSNLLSSPQCENEDGRVEFR